jgi:negative regulator of sigma E activity
MPVTFVIAALCLAAAVSLAVHHGVKHHSEPTDSKAKTESSVWVAYLQPSNVANHETWILVLTSIAITLFAVPTC